MPEDRSGEDPFGMYIEWAEHRLNPGHYLGGTIEPHLRKSTLGPRARRLSGVLLLFSGVSGLAGVATSTTAVPITPGLGFYPYLSLALGGAVSVLTLVAGVVMFRAGV